MPDTVYAPATPLDLDRAARHRRRLRAVLAAWFALVDDAAATFAASVESDEPSPITIWPEHFDLALSAAR